MLYDNKHIEKSLNEMGFEDFTEIQKETIPLLINGSDVIGHSQTGTGKTAAFAIPILEKIDYKSDKIQAIILCPTRELVVQVKREIDKIGKYIPGLKTISVYGGEPISKQIGHLKRRPQIVVGTPGRTIDHINRKLIKLQNVKFCVLDEADEMLKMGFKEDIEIILGATNPDRQTVLFSATMPKVIIGISKKYMRDAKVVSVVQTEQTAKNITQYYYQVADKNKVEAVARLLHVYAPKLTLIFCNTKRKVDDVTRELTKKGYNVDKIHGDLPQTQRLDVLNKFHRGVLDILVATDVAARGLDIKNVEVVINFDVPEKAEYYVHRIGRTGRIGAKGLSFTLVTKKDNRRLQDILKFTKSTITKRNVPTVDKVNAVKQEQDLEEITTLIREDKNTEFKDFAAELLIQNDAVEVVSALLSKLAKNDSSKKVAGDINEDNSRSGRQRGGSRERSGRGENRSGRGDGKGIKRFHLNLGISDGITVQKFANFVAQKTNLRNSQIKDITVRESFAFFSTDAIHEASVMKKMKNVKFQGKQTSIQLAKERKR